MMMLHSLSASIPPNIPAEDVARSHRKISLVTLRHFFHTCGKRKWWCNITNHKVFRGQGTTYFPDDERLPEFLKTTLLFGEQLSKKMMLL